MARQSRNSSSSLEIQLQSRQTTSANMRNFLIFAVALCAVCHAAPAPKEAELDRPSPINPDVVSDPKPAEKVVPLALLLPAQEAKHQQKREEPAPAKPHSIIASETLHQNPDSRNTELPLAKPAGVLGHEALQHDPKKLKRETQSKPAEHSHTQDAHDGHNAPAGVLGHEAIQHDPKKQKRDSHSKPAEHSQTHDAHDSHDGHKAHAAVIPQAEHGDHKAARHQRDIPVPTEVKTKPETSEDTEKPQVEDVHSHVPAAVGNEHAHGPLRHHPVPVAELFNKPKTNPQHSDSSSEESKESKESKETKA